MKNKTLKIILVFSLLLNASMLLTAGYIHYTQSPAPSFPFIAGHRPGETLQGYFFEGLSLKPEQQKAMQQKALAFHGDINKTREQIDAKRASLIALLREDNPNGQAIALAIAEINKLQETVQKKVVLHLLEFKGMLDKEHQKKFLDLIEGVMAGKPGTHCP
jgi:Spy/CpxP family protein refolding chaperone